MLLDDLAEEYDALSVDQERRWIGGLLRGVPAEPVQVRERIAGIHQQIEVSGNFFIRQELVRPGAKILRRTRVDKHHMGAGIGKAL